MEAEKLELIVNRLRKRSVKYESNDDSKAHFYDECADFIENNSDEFMGILENEIWDAEKALKEIISRYKEIEQECNNWEMMFPEGMDD